MSDADKSEKVGLIKNTANGIKPSAVFFEAEARLYEMSFALSNMTFTAKC